MGAYGGPVEIMDHVSPVGPIHRHAIGNPAGDRAAGLATPSLKNPARSNGIVDTMTALCNGSAHRARELEFVFQTQV